MQFQTIEQKIAQYSSSARVFPFNLEYCFHTTNQMHARTYKDILIKFCEFVFQILM